MASETKTEQSWSVLSLKMIAGLAVAGAIFAMGFARDAFFLGNTLILIVLSVKFLPLFKSTPMFKPLEGTPSFWTLWCWWEKRRIPVNLFGLITLLAIEIEYYMSFTTSVPRHSCGNPLFYGMLALLIFLPVFLNLVYFLNPIIDFSIMKVRKSLHSDRLMHYLCMLLLIFASIFGGLALTHWQMAIYLGQ